METIFDANEIQGLLTIEESVLQATEYIEEKGHHCMQFKGSEAIINGWSNIENENHPLFNFISRFNRIMSHCNSIFEIGKFMCYISQYCFFLNWNNFSLGSKNRRKRLKFEVISKNNTFKNSWKPENPCLIKARESRSTTFHVHYLHVAQPSHPAAGVWCMLAQLRPAAAPDCIEMVPRKDWKMSALFHGMPSIPFRFFFLFLLQFWLQCTAFRDNGYDYDYFLRAKVSMRKRKVGWGDIISKSRWSFRKRTILARLLHIIITEWWHWCHVHYCTALWKNGEGRGL